MLEKWLVLAGFGAAVFALVYNAYGPIRDWLRFQSIGTRDYVVEKLNLMFIDASPQTVLIGQFALAGGCGLLAFAAVAPEWVPALGLGAMATVVGWKAPKPVVDYLYKRRVDKFGMQLVDGLSLMSNGMKSGLSVVQALGMVAQEMPDPIRQEFNLVLSENKLGVSIEDAFNNLAKRVKSDDVEMFVTSINILKETGGNMAETFDTIVVTIRERIKVGNKIDAMTAQGRMQGYFLLAVPPIMGMVMHESDPELMRPLLTTPLGWVILLGVAALEVIAFFAIMRLVKIEV